MYAAVVGYFREKTGAAAYVVLTDLPDKDVKLPAPADEAAPAEATPAEADLADPAEPVRGMSWS